MLVLSKYLGVQNFTSLYNFSKYVFFKLKVILPKPSQGKFESRRDAIVKESKRKKEIGYRSIRKITVLESEPERKPISEKRKSDSEEGKMVSNLFSHSSFFFPHFFVLKLSSDTVKSKSLFNFIAKNHHIM